MMPELCLDAIDVSLQGGKLSMMISHASSMLRRGDYDVSGDFAPATDAGETLFY